MKLARGRGAKTGPGALSTAKFHSTPSPCTPGRPRESLEGAREYLRRERARRGKGGGVRFTQHRNAEKVYPARAMAARAMGARMGAGGCTNGLRIHLACDGDASGGVRRGTKTRAGAGEGRSSTREKESPLLFTHASECSGRAESLRALKTNTSRGQGYGLTRVGRSLRGGLLGRHGER